MATPTATRPFGEEFKARREEDGLSQAQVARALKMTEKTIHRWERRELPPSDANLLLIEARLGWTFVSAGNEQRQNEPASPSSHRRRSERSRVLAHRGQLAPAA